MKLKDITSLFPLKGQLTQEILDKANIHDINKCNGALTLKAALPEGMQDYVTWGVYTGVVYTNKKKQDTIGSHAVISTLEDLDFMDATTPQEVTFVLVGVNKPS